MFIPSTILKMALDAGKEFLTLTYSRHPPFLALKAIAFPRNSN